MFRIAEHKTAEKVPALVLLTAKEEKALTSFFKYYRSIVSPCKRKIAWTQGKTWNGIARKKGVRIDA